MEVYQDQKERLSVGQWILTIFIIAVPLLNIIMLFVWAFGGNKDERENFAKASLIWVLIGILISVALISCVGFAAFTSMALY